MRNIRYTYSKTLESEIRSVVLEWQKMDRQTDMAELMKTFFVNFLCQ